jgi:hypothetical protein
MESGDCWSLTASFPRAWIPSWPHLRPQVCRPLAKKEAKEKFIDDLSQSRAERAAHVRRIDFSEHLVSELFPTTYMSPTTLTTRACKERISLPVKIFFLFKRTNELDR